MILWKPPQEQLVILRKFKKLKRAHKAKTSVLSKILGVDVVVHERGSCIFCPRNIRFPDDRIERLLETYPGLKKVSSRDGDYLENRANDHGDDFYNNIFKPIGFADVSDGAIVSEMFDSFYLQFSLSLHKIDGTSYFEISGPTTTKLRKLGYEPFEISAVKPAKRITKPKGFWQSVNGA